jgi:hypothetical protein
MKILASSCDFRFFEACRTLISSCYRFYPSVGEIWIFDLGLKEEQKKYFKTLKKVVLKEYDKDLVDKFPHFLHPKTFAWKTFIVKELTKTKGDIVAYLDSGACLVGDFSKAISIVEEQDILLVNDSHDLKKYTHETCFNIMNASEKERNSTIIWAGFQMYKAQGRFQNIVTDAFEYAKNKDCIAGDVSIHRHDQSIYSVLSVRYSAPRQNISIFGEYRGPSISREQIIYAHRNTYHNTEML